jgi:hypothetical protein
MVGRQRVGRNGLIFPQESPDTWFGDILNIEESFVEIGPRSVFDKSGVGVRQ